MNAKAGQGQGHNAGSSNGCNPWFATNATTGQPIDDPKEYEDKRHDLEQAREDRLERDKALLSTGQTLFKTFGKVTVTYTVTHALGSQGSGCTFLAKYVSDGGTIVWFHTIYNKRLRRHIAHDTFTVYPP